MLHTVVAKPDAMCKEKDLQFCEIALEYKAEILEFRILLRKKKKKEEKEWETV